MHKFVSVRSILFATITALTVHIASIEAQHRKVDQPLPDKLYESYIQKRDSITKAIAKSTSEWAGTYLAGDHHPTVFQWTPEEGFLVASSLHTFEPSWINYGKVELGSSSLIVDPVLAKENSSAYLMPREFRLVKWGRQHFLIPPAQLRLFAYAVHSGSESEIVQLFARSEDSQYPRRGLPNIPSEFLRVMKMPAIKARLSSVGPEENVPSVTIAAGSRHRVVEGMILYYRSRCGAQFSVRINEVAESRAEGEVWSTGSTDNSCDVRVRPGLILSSKMPQNFFEPG